MTTKFNNWAKKTLSDMSIRIDSPVRIYERHGTARYWEKLERALQDEARDIEEFIRDHRSRDKYSLTVEKRHNVVCQFCGWDYGEFGESSDMITPDCCEEAMRATGFMIADYEPHEHH